MAGIDDQVGTRAGVRPSDEALRYVSNAEVELTKAGEALAAAKEEYATAFLRAKISAKNPTDRQAEASAQVEAGKALTAAETDYFIAKELLAAAARNLGGCSCQ